MAHVSRNVFKRVVAYDPYLIDGDFPAYVERAATLTDLARAGGRRSRPHAAHRGNARHDRCRDSSPRSSRGAYFVNTARGAVVNVADLAARARRRHAGGRGARRAAGGAGGARLAAARASARDPDAARRVLFGGVGSRNCGARPRRTSLPGLRPAGPNTSSRAARAYLDGSPCSTKASRVSARRAKRMTRALGDGMAAVIITGVEKWFGSTHVIRGVDVAIADGEFCVLVGPSGCGKSTLLRMIAGLEEITEGEIAIGGRVVNRVPPKERDIAMVFQNYALYPHMTVRDNMSFALALAKQPKSEIEAHVKKAADILGLAPYLDRYPRQLSGGQRQRVAMGRAIVRDPQVFLFDEPLSNLDAQAARADAHRDQGAAPAPADHVDLRHARPDRGDDDGRQDRRDARRRRRADRRSAGAVRPSGQHVRRRIHRLAGDEHDPRHRRASTAGTPHVAFADGATLPLPAGIARGRRAAGALRHPARALRGRRRRRLCRSTSSSSSPPAPTRSFIAGSTARKSRRWCATASTARAGERIALVPDLPRAHVFDAASGVALAA